MTFVRSKSILFYKHFRFIRFLFTCSINYAKPVKLVYKKYNEDIVATTTNPPLIILHGLIGCKSNWNTIAKKLTTKLNPARVIYILDARNHGKSPHDPDISYEAMSEDLKLFIDTEIPEKNVALMGHSMGGLTTILFALKWPQMVEKLLIIDSSPVNSQKKTKIMMVLRKLMQIMHSFPITNKNTTLTKERQKLYAYLKEEIPNKRTRQFISKNLIIKNGSIQWQLNLPVLIENLENLERFPNFIGQKQYMGPSYIIGGAESDFLRTSDFPTIRELLPKVEFKFIENAGHWLHYESPDEFIKIVSKKLNKY